MQTAPISFLQNAVLDWPNRPIFDAQETGRWQILQLRRRQTCSATHFLPAGILIATEGVVHVQRAGLDAALPTGQALILEEWSSGTQIICGAQAQAVWIGLARGQIRQSLVSQWLDLPSEAISAVILALSQQAAGQSLLMQLERMAAHIRTGQLGMSELLDRCPGRSRRHREDVLMRLQRVKSMLDLPQGPVVELDLLARVANYSLSHFQRMFTRVYQLSPIEHQRQSRLARARELISAQRLSVREVAESVGFESRSTFNRLFRERFGNSAGRVRNASM